MINDENEKCLYSISSSEQCTFNINNSTSMDGADKIHRTELKKGQKYYIKCSDVFNNYPGSCSIIVKGGSYEAKTQEL